MKLMQRRGYTSVYTSMHKTFMHKTFMHKALMHEDTYMFYAS